MKELVNEYLNYAKHLHATTGLFYYYHRVLIKS